MEQIEIIKKWLLSENIPFEYNYEKMPPDFLETMGEFILSEEEKLSRNQIFLRRQHENGYDISIICHFGSWGVKQGLLEYWRMGKDKDPVGYCTAEEVIDVIKEWVKDGR